MDISNIKTLTNLEPKNINPGNINKSAGASASSATDPIYVSSPPDMMDSNPYTGPSVTVDLSDEAGIWAKHQEEMDAEMAEMDNNFRAASKRNNTYEADFLGVITPLGSPDQFSSTGSLNSLTAKYEEMYNGINADFTGREKEERINKLDAAYEKALDGVASWQNTLINSANLINNLKERVYSRNGDRDRNHHHRRSDRLSRREEHDRYSRYNRYSRYEDLDRVSGRGRYSREIEELTRKTAESILQYGKSAAEYIKNNGALSDSGSFSSYMNENSGPYSFSDLNALAPLLSNAPGWDYARNDALKNLRHSGFSRDIRTALRHIV